MKTYLVASDYDEPFVLVTSATGHSLWYEAYTLCKCAHNLQIAEL